MPVSLTEWRVRIGRFFQNPLDINKQEMIQRFLERWKAKKEKTAASTSAAQDQVSCQTKKENNLKTAATPLSTQDQAQCASAKEEKLKMAASPPSTQDETPCESAKEGKAKLAASQPSTQDQTPCKSAKKKKPTLVAIPPATQGQTPCHLAKKEIPKMAASPPAIQTPCTPSCTPQTNLVPSSADTCPVVMSSITQVLLMLMTLMTVCFQWCRKQCSSLMFGQLDRQVETAEPLETSTKVFLSMSCFASGLQCFRRMICNAMGGFFHLYLALILLMRSGDIETNPGPNTLESTVSDKEFLKLSQCIHPSYYMAVGISLGFSHTKLDAILIEKLNNYPNALLVVFLKWNVMEQPPNTNKREVLADALRENDLGDLSERLHNGCLLPDITGGPLRSPKSQIQPPPSESQTKPLSPELIERCANDFKFKYRSTICKIRADPLDPASLVQFEDMYTNLALEEEHRREKRAIDYNDLLDLKVNGQFPKRLMVQGEAGAGKTTLCAKIAWDWIEEKYFKKFEWVLIVHLRDAKQYTLGQIAKSYLARDNPATACQLAEYIRSNQDKVFIAFDGLDEFSSKDISKSECQQSQAPLQPSQSRADSSEACGSPPQTSDIHIVDILCSVQLASCPVLVTTRPWRAVEIRSDAKLMELYAFIHVEGFSRENVSVYIHKYFAEDNDKAEQLIQFTHENDVVSENMAHYPIYVAMLCLMWKLLGEQKLERIKSLQTFSQIFKEMIGFLKEHYAQKKITKVGSPSLIAYLEKINKLLEPVAKKAFTGLLKNTLVFSDSDFQSCPESMETACRVGILSQEDRIKSDSSSGANSHVQLPVFFPHKLFQEYMAGVYLASLYESDRSEFNRLIGDVVLSGKKEFRYLLYFTVSQNKTIACCVMESMMQNYDIDGFKWKEGDEDRDFIVDVAFESQDPDVATFIVKDKPSSQIELIIHQVMTAHTVAGYAFTRLPVVDLTVLRNCGPTVSLDVGEMICSIPSLTKASLQLASFHNRFYAVLAQKGSESQVQTMSLAGVKCITPDSSHDLVEALCSMPNLNDLTLKAMDLSDEFCSTLKAKASSLQIQILRLERFQCLTPTSSHDLAEALCSMPNLNNLALYTMNPSDEFCFTLKARASSIQGCFPQIRNGNFRFNGVLQEDLNSFLHSLASCSRPRQPLPMGSNMRPDNFREEVSGSKCSLFQVLPSTRDVIGTSLIPQGYTAHQPTSPRQRPVGGRYHGNTHIPASVFSEQSRAVYQDDVTRARSALPMYADNHVPLDPRGSSTSTPALQRSHNSLPVRQPLGQMRIPAGSRPVDWGNGAMTGNPRQRQFMPHNVQSGMPPRYHTTLQHHPFSDSTWNPPYHAYSSSYAPLCNPPIPGYHPPFMFEGQHSPVQRQPSLQDGTLSTNRHEFAQYPLDHNILSSMSNLHVTVSRNLQPNMPTGQQSAFPYDPAIQQRTDSSSRPGTSSQFSHTGNFLSPTHGTPSTARGQVYHGGSSSDTVGQFSHTYSRGRGSQSRSHRRQARLTKVKSSTGGS